MIKAIIVDDEKDGREALGKMIRSYCKNVRVEAMVDSVATAIPAIRKYNPDVLFLDVEMPDGTGFDLLRQLNDVSFKIIFITAHQHYALKAFKFSALDYLLKPVDIDELTEAIKRVEMSAPAAPDKKESIPLPGSDRDSFNQISIPVSDGIVYLTIAEIIRFAADGSYTTVFLSNGKSYMVSKNIKEYEMLLSEKDFFRCHISHLINLKHVRRFSRHDGYYANMSDGTSIEIARRKKDDFVVRMNRLK